MKIIKNILNLLLFVVSLALSLRVKASEAKQISNGSVSNQSSYNLENSDFHKFIKKHEPDIKLRNLIERNKDLISKKDYGAIFYDSSLYDSIFLKGKDLHRVINAERMRECIKKHNLNLLDVAKKYIYSINGEYRIAAEYIYTCGGTCISLELIQQLAKLAEETGFKDWGTNWIYTSNGKLVCIDTEDISFLTIGGCYSNKIHKNCKAQYLIGLMIWKNAMKPEAYEWLSKRINILLNDPEGITEYPNVIDNTKFDNKDINILEVKKHINKMQEQKYKLLKSKL